MIQATKDQDAMGSGITPYICLSETVSMGIQLKHVPRRMFDTGVGKMSVSVMTITSLDDNLTTAKHGSN